MKKSILFSTLLLLYSSVVYAQQSCSPGLNCIPLSTSGAGAVTGTAFAMPGGGGNANIITWTVTSDGTPSANLEGSNDNSTWFTIDSTATTGIRNYGLTAVKFARISQVSRTGGTTTTGSFVIGRASGAQGLFTGTVGLSNGSASNPSLFFTSETNSGIYKNATNQFAFSIAGAPRVVITGTGFSVPLDTANLLFGASADTGLKRLSAATLEVTNGSATIGTLFANIGAGNTLISVFNPTISSGFGTSPSIVSPNGAGSFQVNVGTGGTATTGVLAMNSTAAHGWNCWINDQTAANTNTGLQTRQQANTTTTVTIQSQTAAGVATAWAASSILGLSCFSF